jgi:photosystem II stability/assembly factor-like uncharacterized protein
MKFLRASALLALATFSIPFASASENDAWTSNGPPGASVYAIAPAPSNPSIVYVGTGRGVWQGQRGGASWTDASSGLPVYRVQAAAVDPTDADVVYAGTITPFGVPSAGLFKSTDGGASWAEANEGLFDPFTLADPLDVPAISIDPSNPQVLVAGTRFSEIFRSADGGATWTPQTFGGFNLGLETTGLARDPSNPQRIYAATTVGLLLSVDGGLDWNFFGNAAISFFSITVDPATPSTVYAGNLNGFGLGKSLDSGATWLSANGNLPHVTVDGVDFFPPIRAIAVAPDGSAVYLATEGTGLFRSTDGGASWTALEAGLNERDFHSLAFLPGQPATTLLAGGNGGGVYRSDDGGANWSKTSLGLDEALVTAVDANPLIPGKAYASTFDGVYATADGGGTWTRASGGLPPEPVAALAVTEVIHLQPGDPETIYAGTLGGGLWTSVDGGTSWLRRDGLEDDFISAVAIDPVNIFNVYAGTDHPFDGSNPQGVYKSADGGATWQRMGLDPGGFPIDVLAIDPSNPSRIGAASRGLGGYFQSTNGGVSWTSVTPGGGCGAVNTVLYPGVGDRVLVGASNGVCRSENGGATWTLHSVAAFASVQDLQTDRDDPSLVYAATAPALPGGNGGGVFRSTDGGSTWSPFGTGLSTFTVRSLALDAGAINVSLYAGIFRGGVAVLPLGDPPRDPETPAPSERVPRVVERP